MREYWVVDPQDLRIAVHRREAGGALRKTDVLTAGGEHVLTTSILPGFHLSLVEYFR